MTAQTRDVAYTHSFSSPVGLLHAAVDRVGRVLFLSYREYANLPTGWTQQTNKYACGELEYQLGQYFAGERQEFSLELHLEGTGFQKAVWSRLMKTRFGETVSYGYVAQKIGRRDAARAVGNAVAANPVVIIVPCHRVLPADGSLGNYALKFLSPEEGRRAKQCLLALEGAAHQADLF